MSDLYNTGNIIVDENSKLNFSGNLIPEVWYRTVVKENGKPNLNAIIILSDVIYWYRAAEVRDEFTGQLIGFKKKFKGDLLQRSYQQIAEKFGLSKREAANAVISLEELGVIKRIFRTIEMNGYLYNNVLFLELNVEKVKAITYPVQEDIEKQECITESDAAIKSEILIEGEELPGSQLELEYIIRSDDDESYNSTEELIMLSGDTFKNTEVPAQDTSETPITLKSDRGHFEKGHPPTLKSDRGHFEKGYPPTLKSDTYTKNTTKNIINNIYTSSSSYDEIKIQFKTQIQYEDIHASLPQCANLLDVIIDIVVNVMLSSSPTVRINKEDMSVEKVKECFSRLNSEHIVSVISNLTSYSGKVTNARSLLLTSLYNAPIMANLPLKDSSPKKSTNKFNNFHQRDYDYEMLERALLTRK